MAEPAGPLKTELLRPDRATEAELKTALTEVASHPATGALLETLGGTVRLESSAAGTIASIRLPRTRPS